MVAEERKYALVKVKAGDYLLPSNDAQTLWRIMRYTDGQSMGLDFPDRDFWALWKWLGPDLSNVDVDDWDRWGHWDGNFDSRTAAIDTALGAA